MIDDFNQVRRSFLKKVSSSVNFSDRDEYSLFLAKKYTDYAFSKEFRQDWEDSKFREMHPALKDLYEQYKEMETLLKKEEKTK